ncbi:Heat shock transcription factor [Rhodotorula toruloides]
MPPASSTGLELALAAPLASSSHQLAVPASALPTKPNKATQRAVPAFLNKLYSMVSDPETDDLIRWSDDGDSFFVPSADRFGRELLPRFFKHSNFGSFVRQLNMYGFHKVPHIQQGVLKKDSSEEADMLEFSNPHFIRGQPDLLNMIKRQKAGKADAAAALAGEGSNSSLDIPTLLTDLAAIRKHQTAISADLKDLQARNHALWQEALASREKHKKQEETINKILRFLAGVFGGQVLDAGQGPAVGAVGNGSAGAASVGAGAAAGRSANINANGVVLMPKSRLLLMDVRERQQERAAALKELDGDDDDEIEEIPLLRTTEDDDDLPTISSSSAPTATMGTVSRTSSATPFSPKNRFAAIPSPSSAPSATPGASSSLIDPAQYNLSPEALNALLAAAGNNPEALSSFLTSHRNSAAPTASTSLALAAPTSNPFAMLGSATPTPSSSASSSSFPFAPTATSNPLDLPLASTSSARTLSPTFASAFAENNDALSSVLSEKADIDQRTAVLESQISKLLQHLPEDAREQVESDLPLPEGSDPNDWAGVNWSSYVGEGGAVDFDKMLAQLSEMSGGASPSASTSALPAIDYADYLNPDTAVTSGAIDPALYAETFPSTSTFTATSTLSALPFQQTFSVTSPSGTVSDQMGSPASTVTAESASAASTPTADGAAATRGGASSRGKKRKSDALGAQSSAASEGGAASPEGAAGTRKSARRRKA